MSNIGEYAEGDGGRDMSMYITRHEHCVYGTGRVHIKVSNDARKAIVYAENPQTVSVGVKHVIR